MLIARALCGQEMTRGEIGAGPGRPVAVPEHDRPAGPRWLPTEPEVDRASGSRVGRPGRIEPSSPLLGSRAEIGGRVAPCRPYSGIPRLGYRYMGDIELIVRQGAPHSGRERISRSADSVGEAAQYRRFSGIHPARIPLNRPQ